MAGKKVNIVKKIINTVSLRLFGAIPYRTPKNIEPTGYTTTQQPEQPPFNEWLSNLINSLKEK